jgi:hypothetical protein
VDIIFVVFSSLKISYSNSEMDRFVTQIIIINFIYFVWHICNKNKQSEQNQTQSFFAKANICLFSHNSKSQPPVFRHITLL